METWQKEPVCVPLFLWDLQRQCPESVLSWSLASRSWKEFQRSSEESMLQSLPAFWLDQTLLISACTRNLHLERRRETKKSMQGIFVAQHGAGERTCERMHLIPWTEGENRVTTAAPTCGWDVARCSHPLRGRSKRWVKPQRWVGAYRRQQRKEKVRKPAAAELSWCVAIPGPLP